MRRARIPHVRLVNFQHVTAGPTEPALSIMTCLGRLKPESQRENCSVHLDARDLDDLPPLLGFGRDVFTELGGRHQHRLHA
jgi:hypothetical protein